MKIFSDILVASADYEGPLEWMDVRDYIVDEYNRFCYETNSDLIPYDLNYKLQEQQYI